MSISRAAIYAALLLTGLFSAGASSQDVTLRSRDGSVTVSGNFVGFDGEFYRVDTEFGILTVDSSGVQCDGPACPDLSGFYPILRIAADATVTQELLPDLIAAFADENGYDLDVGSADNSVQLSDRKTGSVAARIEVLSTSSAKGFSALLSEGADIFMSLREATEAEKKSFKSAGVADLNDPLRARVLALDAVVPIVSPLNRVGAISLVDLGAIAAGKITNWADVGGQDAPISMFIDRDMTADGSPVQSLIMQPNGSVFGPEISIVETATQALSAVESDPYAIAFGRLSARGSVKNLALTGDCGFRADAESADIKTEDYPISLPVFLYSPARRLPKLGRDFMAYALSPSAQHVVARSSFVDQSVEALAFEDQGRRFANAIRHAGEEISLDDLQEITSDLYGARRLSLGFRFDGGSARLDAQSRSNVQLVAQLIEAGVFDGDVLTLAGFSDGRGDAATNQRLSQKRAEAVRKTIMDALGEAFEPDRITFRVRGFGEAMPLACDDVAWGRLLNRRVELWVSNNG